MVITIKKKGGVTKMRKETEIANDLYERCGALLCIADVQRYTSLSRNTVINLLCDLTAKQRGAHKKQYFYKDVAKAIAAHIAM